ncbi:hypothetical protein TWF102_007201 [Orbilia oligospora]|uniref:Uncharacterized protein n=1 Tax=Orbilia oligospora TaxID=2813651 RepID=A0A7C8JDE6_ORBOL|nr:hypothetical protein TWF102_007201 [Orbilia oligospora]KAF3102851.1 hypothetical protein TWF103_007553 [Orbilia oligospora]
MLAGRIDATHEPCFCPVGFYFSELLQVLCLICLSLRNCRFRLAFKAVVEAEAQTSPLLEFSDCDRFPSHPHLHRLILFSLLDRCASIPNIEAPPESQLSNIYIPDTNPFTSCRGSSGLLHFSPLHWRSKAPKK